MHSPSSPIMLKPFITMGAALQDQGNLEEAIDAYQKAILSSLIMLKPTTTWAMLSKSKAS